MVFATVCRSVLVAGVVGLAGCAQEGARPSYLGLADLSDSGPAGSQPSPADKDVSNVLRHIQSNKVLSAIAFQSVTGQTVDPDRLVGHAGE